MTSNMNYSDLGFNRFLTNELFPPRASAVDLMGQYNQGAVTTKLLANEAVKTANIEDLAVTSAKVNDLAADKITAGTISANVSIGTNNILLDGTNWRQVISDGSTNRIVIGKLTGAF